MCVTATRSPKHYVCMQLNCKAITFLQRIALNGLFYEATYFYNELSMILINVK